MHFISTVAIGEEVVKGKNESYEFRLPDKNERLIKGTYLLFIGLPQFNWFSELLWQLFFLKFMYKKIIMFYHYPIELFYICHVQYDSDEPHVPIEHLNYD